MRNTNNNTANEYLHAHINVRYTFPSPSRIELLKSKAQCRRTSIVMPVKCQ